MLGGNLDVEVEVMVTTTVASCHEHADNELEGRVVLGRDFWGREGAAVVWAGADSGNGAWTGLVMKERRIQFELET